MGVQTSRLEKASSLFMHINIYACKMVYWKKLKGPILCLGFGILPREEEETRKSYLPLQKVTSPFKSYLPLQMKDASIKVKRVFLYEFIRMKMENI